MGILRFNDPPSKSHTPQCSDEYKCICKQHLHPLSDVELKQGGHFSKEVESLLEVGGSCTSGKCIKDYEKLWDWSTVIKEGKCGDAKDVLKGYQENCDPKPFKWDHSIVKCMESLENDGDAVTYKTPDGNYKLRLFKKNGKNGENGRVHYEVSGCEKKETSGRRLLQSGGSSDNSC